MLQNVGKSCLWYGCCQQGTRLSVQMMAGESFAENWHGGVKPPNKTGGHLYLQRVGGRHGPTEVTLCLESSFPGGLPGYVSYCFSNCYLLHNNFTILGVRWLMYLLCSVLPTAHFEMADYFPKMKKEQRKKHYLFPGVYEYTV